MYESTRLFLERVLPWGPVGQQPTKAGPFINIHWRQQKPGSDKVHFNGAPCTSVNECIRVIHKQSANRNVLDLYVCMSTQRECEERASAFGGGEAWRIAYREQRNAVELRSLWMDFDVQYGGKHQNDTAYASPEEAAAALQTFLQQANIPPPTLIVLTGSGGFHAHWTLSVPLPPAAWQPLAEALANAAVRHNIKFDHAITTDSARVLRLPETRNSKAENKLASLVNGGNDYSLKEVQDFLAPYIGAKLIPMRTTGYPRGNQPLTGINAALAGGIEQHRVPISLMSVFDAGCGFVQEAVATGGMRFSEVLWRDTCRIAMFTEGGVDDACLMAEGHPGYDEEKTREKFDKVGEYQKERDLGWPKCDTIAKHGCTHCATCPLYEPGANKSPLHYGKTKEEAVAAEPIEQLQEDEELPPGYLRTDKGHVAVMDYSKKPPTPVTVCPYWIGEASLQNYPHWALNFFACLQYDQRRTAISVPAEILANKHKFAEHLGLYGIVVKGPEKEATQMFMQSWYQQLQKIKGKVLHAQPFGWVEDDTGQLAGFSYGGLRYEPGETKVAGHGEGALVRLHTPRGDLDVWKAAARMITNLGSPEREVLVAGAFAGPLVNFTGQSGLVVAGYASDPGIGKTTSLKVGLSVWAHSHKALSGNSDTTNSLGGKMASLQHLPIFWDELKDAEANKRFASFIWNISQGNEKNRMKKNLELAEAGSWKTMLVCANNVSVVELLNDMNKATIAGAYRIFEYPVPPWRKGQLTLSLADAEQVIKMTEDNYGRAGEIYAKYLGENHERISDEVADRVAQLVERFNAKSEQRFWVCTCACLLQGAIYANELDLTKFDIDAMEVFLERSFLEMERSAKQSPNNLSTSAAVANRLAQYLGDMRMSHTLKTDKMHVGQGRPAEADKPRQLNFMAKLDGGLYVHISQKPALMLISYTHFKEYFAAKGISPATLINSMEKNWEVKVANRRLGAGTEYTTPKMQVLEFDLTNEDLRKFLMED